MSKLIIKCNVCADADAEFVALTDKGSRGKGFVRCTKCGKEGRTYGSKYPAVLAWNREPVLAKQRTITQQDLIDKINFRCEENNWDYARLSKESGVPLGTLLNIIHGNTKNPGIFTILKLCDAFDMTLADFMEMQED